MTPIIVVKNLSVQFGNFLALDDINFKCYPGEFVSIVGKSGAGKSTFLNAIAGFIPYKGQIERPRNFGYVFQNYALFPWMTVAKNIEFGLSHLDKEARRKRVEEMLHKIGMLEFAKRYPNQLSGGQVQRVALARALAPDPQVLLMDEPYGALDHHTRERMQDWLLSIWQYTTKTILFVTHYIEEAIFLSDRIIVVDQKKFVAEVKVPFTRPRDSEVRFANELLTLKHQILDFMENN